MCTLTSPHSWSRLGMIVLLLGALAIVNVSAQRTITGNVVDADNDRPVRGAIVRIGANGARSDRPLSTATTDQNGDFEIAVEDTTGVLSISVPGYAVKRLRTSSITVGTPLRVALEKAASLRLHVRDPRGGMLPAMLSIATQSPGNYIVSGAQSRSGEFSLSELPLGRTTIVAKAEGHAPATLSLQVEAGQRYGPFSLTLQQAGTISGTVVNPAGTPVRGAVVDVSYTSDLSERRTVSNYLGGRFRTRDDGRFHVTNIVPNATVTVMANGLASSRVSLSLTPGEDRTDVILVVP